MKSKRRHDLQTNVLADWLSKKIAWLQSNATWLLGGTLVLVAIMALLAIRENRVASAAADGWGRFEKATGAGFNAIRTDEQLALNNAIHELEDVARTYEGSPLAAYARLTHGDLSLMDGQRKYLSNKSAANESFQNATQQYRAVAGNVSRPELENRALYSLGKSLEWQMKLEQAKEAYSKVTGTFAVEAQSRVRDLERKGTHAFYEQITQYKPPEKPKADAARYPGIDFNLQEDSPPGEAEEKAFEDAIDGDGLEDAAGAASSGGVAADLPAGDKKKSDSKEGDDAGPIKKESKPAGEDTPAANPSTPKP